MSASGGCAIISRHRASVEASIGMCGSKWCLYFILNSDSPLMEILHSKLHPVFSIPSKLSGLYSLSRRPAALYNLLSLGKQGDGVYKIGKAQ